MNRRDFLRRIAGGAALASGLVVPDQALAVGEEVTRRWWALGAIPDRDAQMKQWFLEHIEGMLVRTAGIDDYIILDEKRYPIWRPPLEDLWLTAGRFDAHPRPMTKVCDFTTDVKAYR